MEENQELDSAQRAVRAISRHMALLYYHLTKEMIAEYGEDAKAVIERAIVAFGRERGENIAKKVLADGGELSIENLDKYYDIPIATGWPLHRSYEGNKKRNTTDSCSFAELWLEKDWGDVGHIYCLTDTALREGYSSHVVYHPGKNILQGDDCCTSLTEYID